LRLAAGGPNERTLRNEPTDGRACKSIASRGLDTCRFLGKKNSRLAPAPHHRAALGREGCRTVWGDRMILFTLPPIRSTRDICRAGGSSSYTVGQKFALEPYSVTPSTKHVRVGGQLKHLFFFSEMGSQARIWNWSRISPGKSRPRPGGGLGNGKVRFGQKADHLPPVWCSARSISTRAAASGRGIPIAFGPDRPRGCICRPRFRGSQIDTA